MGNESGTWIMYGVDWDDPECIHTVDEAIEYINKVGCRYLQITAEMVMTSMLSMRMVKHRGNTKR